MTSQYIAVIEEQLETKYPQNQQQDTLTLQNIRFKIFLPKTTLMLNKYQNLRALNINHCDLRNLDNFPKIYSLEQLDLGFNQIQGTFNNLMPLKKLKYLNIQHNLIFESIKLAPLRKIASANSNSQEKNQTKISVCIRNNPFIQQDTPYLIKFKNYGLKVIKQPKEYFDKKKQDEEKQTKTKSSGKKGKKNQQSATKSNKKKKINWYQQSSQDSSLVSHPSPIVRSQTNNDHHQSSVNNNFNNPSSNNMGHNIDRRPITHEDRMQYLRVSRNNIIDNFRGQPGRLLARMGSSRVNTGQVMMLDDQPFFNLDLVDDEDEINEMRGMFEDEDSDSDDNEQEDRFAIGQQPNDNQQAIEERIRSIERRNARYQQMRQLHRQQRLQQQRIRLQRRQQQRQNQLLRRRIQYERRRQERELLRRQEERQRLREQQRQLIRRLSSSSGGRNMFLDALPSNLGSRLSSNVHESSIPLQSPPYYGRPMGYRESLHRRIIANQSNAESINPNELSNRSIGSLIPPLRVRPSDDPNSNIIHLQRASSISSNPNQILFGSENNQRMQVFNNQNMDSYSDQDEDENENDQENIQDHDDEEEEQGLHICDSNCEDDHFQREEEQEEDENEEPLGLDVLPILDGNGNVVDYDDSGIQRFIDVIGNNPNILRQNIDDIDQSSDGQYDLVINDDGAPQIRRNNNQASNLSSQPGNPQPESQMPQDQENSSSG